MNGYGGFDLRFIWVCCLCCTAAVILFFSGKQNFFLIDWASNFFFFFVGPQIGLNPLTGLVGPTGAGPGPRKKTRLVNEPGPGHGS